MPLHARFRFGFAARSARAWCALAGLVVVASIGLAARPAVAGHVLLEWTAPGDDSTLGRATEYDLRWSLRSAQFPGRFATAQRIPLPAPAPSGTNERVVITDIPDGVNAYFALRSRDKHGNWSILSNVLSAQVVTDADAGPGTLAFSLASGNPAHGPTRFSLTTTQRGPATIDVVDVMGRRARTIHDGPLDTGRHSIVWDLHNDDGQASAPGVYFVRAQVQSETFIHRVVVVR